MQDFVADLTMLKDYSQVKLIIAAQLRLLREALTTLGRADGERQCGELLVKLAEDRFTLAVVGQFKRGKSSLMNSIIGRELLPTGVLPLTSAITVLKYGSQERLVVSREKSLFPEELPVSALAEYVTEKGNPANCKRVKMACVEIPEPFLRRGVEFVDTPGIGSVIAANTATTYGFLPQCDAVLFVTSADMPMTDAEKAFLLDIRQYVDRVFFVVNKMDLVEPTEQDEIIDFVRATVQKCMGSESEKIFPVSARQGLTARQSGDLVLFAQSGVKLLEEALAAFLARGKSAAVLAAVVGKALAATKAEAKQTEFFATESFSKRHDPQAALAAISGARGKLQAVYQAIVDGRIDAAAEIEMVWTSQNRAEPQLPAVKREAIPVGEELVKDLQIRGCPVCQQMAKQAMDFFAHWQYRIVTSEQAQAEFANEWGFCPLHTWQLLAVSSPHGASVGYARLAGRIADYLRTQAEEGAPGDKVRQVVRNTTNCYVCKLLGQTEDDYLRQLAERIESETDRELYGRSQGLCLRHLGKLLDGVNTKRSREFLLLHAARLFEEDAEDMRSFAMKQEAIRRGLQNKNETDAYRRAMNRFVGGQKVCLPWSGDREL